MAHWLEILSEYDFQIQHRQGKQHGNADSLSRICDIDECMCYDKGTILEQLPCGGCSQCTEKHRQWSSFFAIDDTVPFHVSAILPPSADVEEDQQQGPTCSSTASEPVCILLLCMIVQIIAALFTLCKDLVACTLNASCTAAQNFNKVGGAVGTTLLHVLAVGRQKRPREPKNGASANGPGPPTDVGTRSTLSGESGSHPSLCSLQDKDPDISVVKAWLKSSDERPTRELAAAESKVVRNLWLQWDQLAVKDGVLYRKAYSSIPGEHVMQAIVPKAMQKDILQSMHDSLMSAHLGVHKTAAKIKQVFYWFRLKESVRDYIRNCASCGARKRPVKSPKAPLATYNVGAPMDRVATDIVGPFPVTERNNRYILVVQDQFSKWAEAYALPDFSAKTVTHRIVYEFISRFGAPLDLHSDQGRNYESHLYKEMCRLLEINKTRTSPFHPSGNFVERFNSTLISMMTAYVSEDQTDWDIHLPLLTAAYRSCEHVTTGYSPNRLMLGREVNLPVHVSLGCTPRLADNDTRSDYITQLKEKMEAVNRLTREHLKQSALRQKRDYDTRVSLNVYKTGDSVYYIDTTKTAGKSPKLKFAKWKGPALVTQKLSDLLYVIKASQNARPKVIHHDRLKPYLCDDLPDWIIQLKSKLDQQDTACSQPSVIVTNGKSLPNTTHTARKSTRNRQHTQRYGLSYSH